MHSTTTKNTAPLSQPPLEIEREIERTVEEAVAFADASPDPSVAALYEDVFAEHYPSDPHA
jgi:TPP-dependent pyruvate/acetoin dehydrogenase alpha subunit